MHTDLYTGDDKVNMGASCKTSAKKLAGGCGGLAFEPRSDSPAVTLHFRDSISFHIVAMSGLISLWLQKELEYMPMLGLLHFSA